MVYFNRTEGYHENKDSRFTPKIKRETLLLGLCIILRDLVYKTISKPI